MSFSGRHVAVSLATLAVAIAARPACAQSDPGAGAPVLEEIIVTAEKRESKVQNIPIAIAAITAQSLQDKRIDSTQSLQLAVPSLVYNNLAEFAQPFLRGIGSDVTQPNADPAVATYVDGVFAASSSGSTQSLLGVERIEVLEGPQGTLYGRNALGGAINVYTLTPHQDLESTVTATYGNYNRTELSGHLSGGLSDTLAVGVYAGFSRRRSYLDFDPSVARNPNEPRHELNGGARFKAVWTPTDIVKLTGSVEYLYGKTFDGVAQAQIQPNAFGYAFGASPYSGRYKISEEYGDYSRTRQINATLREEIDLGWARVLGITGYRHLNESAPVDIDATSASIVGSAAYPLFSRQLSQELQLLSRDDSHIQWIVGAFAYRERGGFVPTVTSSAILFPGFTTTIVNSVVRTTSFAGFGQATIPIFDKLKLTVGGRYTHDHKVHEQSTEDFANAAGTLVAPTAVFPEQTKSWSKFTPRVTLDFKAGDTLLYATYSQGFSSGIFNTSTPTQVLPANPEVLTDYEAGTKSDFLNGRLRVNTSVYLYKFKDIQAEITNPSAMGITTLKNAAKATAYGAELSVSAALTREFTLSASGAYEHTKFDDYPGYPAFAAAPLGNASIIINAAGNQLQRAPKFVGTISLDYTHTLDNGAKIKANINDYYNNGFFWDAGNQLHQPRYNLINMSAGYTLSSGHASISAWVQNLTNKFYYGYQLLSNFGTGAQFASPRMYGVTVSWHL